MEWLAIIPIIVAFLLLSVIFYIGFTPKGRSRMMKSNMDTLKEMTNGETGEAFKDLSKTAIKFKKDILEENQDELKEVAEMQADIEAGAIKKKAAAIKEGFVSDSTMFCKHCGANIDSDSRFCKKCGKEQ